MKRQKAKRKTSGSSGRSQQKIPRHDDFLTDLAAIGSTRKTEVEKESLGDRIRRVREMRGLSINDLSSRTGIDADTLKRTESGEIIPALGQLAKIGKALDMRMGYFISPGIEQVVTVVRQDERRPVSRHGEAKSMKYGYFYESLAPEKADRMMEPFIVTLIPTGTEEFSTHAGQEFIYILEGEIKVQVGDHIHFLKPGDAVYYDSSQPHLVRCVGPKAARVLAVLYTGTK